MTNHIIVFLEKLVSPVVCWETGSEWQINVLTTTGLAALLSVRAQLGTYVRQAKFRLRLVRWFFSGIFRFRPNLRLTRLKMSEIILLGRKAQIKAGLLIPIILIYKGLTVPFKINYWITNEPRHEKACFSHIRTTKAQISLRIRAVWSEPLLFAA